MQIRDPEFVESLSRINWIRTTLLNNLNFRDLWPVIIEVQEAIKRSDTFKNSTFNEARVNNPIKRLVVFAVEMIYNALELITKNNILEYYVRAIKCCTLFSPSRTIKITVEKASRTKLYSQTIQTLKAINRIPAELCGLEISK